MPTKTLPNQIYNQASEIEVWLEKQWQNTTAPFYSSVDLRFSGSKLVPVDTNLFPAGFNLLAPESGPTLSSAIQDHLKNLKLNAKKVLLIPESHTRNIGYHENIAALSEALSNAGLEVSIGTLIDAIKKPKTLTLPSNKQITLSPILREGNKLKTDTFDPDFILLNHDLSGGAPEILQDLEQPIFPPLIAGWSTRKKSDYFEFYQKIANQFSTEFNIDSWFISPLFTQCSNVHLQTHEGEALLAEKASELLSKIKAKYKEYNFDKPPFIMIKAESGTYGIGVISIQDPEEIYTLNRKKRTHMAVGKGKVPISEVIIQEGVYTNETLKSRKQPKKEDVAEPVIYMLGKKVVGGTYRIHPFHESHENLNSPEMYFDHNQLTDLKKSTPEKWYAYTIIARLAALAAAQQTSS